MLVTELVPATEKGSPWLMVVLHGLGDSMEGYRWLPPMLNLPWLNYLLVNAPDDYYGGYSWYDIYGNSQPGIVRSRHLVLDLLDSLPDRGFPPEGTFLFGFSQGCLMVIDVGARYPKKLAGVVGISGYVHDPTQVLRDMSTVAPTQRFLMTHGTEDPLLPIEPVRSQVSVLRNGGLQIEWIEYRKPHTIAGDLELRAIRRFIEAARPGAPGSPDPDRTGPGPVAP
jgi:phospholipase/carboxylesterase